MNSAVAIYHDLSVSVYQLFDSATDKSWYFAQTRPIIDNYWTTIYSSYSNTSQAIWHGVSKDNVSALIIFIKFDFTYLL